MKKLKRILKPFLGLCISAFLLLLALQPVGAASNEKKIFNLLTGKYGFSIAGACGVMSNLRSESGYRPNTGKRYYGLVQWGGGRKSNLKKYCKKHGYSYKSVEGQVAFMVYELKHYSFYKKKIKNAPNTGSGAYHAAYKFCYSYERPAARKSSSVKRAKYAKNKLFPKFKNQKTSKKSSKSSKKSSKEEETKEKTYKTGQYVLQKNMHVRAKADKKSKSLGILKKGKKLKVKKVVNKKWAKITYKKKTGYVSLQSAKKVKK